MEAKFVNHLLVRVPFHTHFIYCTITFTFSVKKSFEDGPTLQHTLPPNEKQPFSFITTVSWTFLEPQYETVKSPPPTMIFSVPYDVFYPFQMSNNNYGISNSGSSSEGSSREKWWAITGRGAKAGVQDCSLTRIKKLKMPPCGYYLRYIMQ